MFVSKRYRLLPKFFVFLEKSFCHKRENVDKNAVSNREIVDKSSRKNKRKKS